MNSGRITRRSRAEMDSAQIDWRASDALTDDDIAAAVRDDPDAAPLLDDEWFDKARLVTPPPKELISIRVDKDVLDFFRSDGAGYQTRINAVLRAFMEHDQRKRRA